MPEHWRLVDFLLSWKNATTIWHIWPVFEHQDAALKTNIAMLLTKSRAAENNAYGVPFYMQMKDSMYDWPYGREQAKQRQLQIC